MARVHSAEVISLSAEKTMPLWNAVGQIVEGWAQVMDGIQPRWFKPAENGNC